MSIRKGFLENRTLLKLKTRACAFQMRAREEEPSRAFGQWDQQESRSGRWKWPTGPLGTHKWSSIHGVQ